MHSGLSDICGQLSFESTFRSSRAPASEDTVRQALRVVSVFNGELTRHGGPYLVGDFSLADVTFVPFVRRLVAYDIPLHDHPLVSAWAARLMARSGVVEWMREAEALPPVH
jgi:glutathione S-transferase